jgi:AraC-like DNA-binding protein
MREDARMSPLPRYREFVPPPAWRGQVRRLWRYRASTLAQAPTRVLPDGCIDLIWDGTQLFVAGPDRVAAMATLAPGSHLTGVRLAPGAAHGLLGCSMDALTGQRVRLRELWGARADAMEARLSTAGSSPFAPLLASLAASAPSVDARMAMLFARLARGDAPRLSQLAGELGSSERALRRHCLAHFGYGPKTLDRILRLQRLLALATDARSLTEAALAAGYADASHLVHDAHDLTALTPTELMDAHGR